MNMTTDVRKKPTKYPLTLSAAAIALFLSSTGGMAQFHATLDTDGNTTVFDTNGQEVPIATADPVGTRPFDCPSDAYYVSEVQSDKTELVLTDCATNQDQYTVEMQGPSSQSDERASGAANDMRKFPALARRRPGARCDTLRARRRRASASHLCTGCHGNGHVRRRGNGLLARVTRPYQASELPRRGRAQHRTRGEGIAVQRRAQGDGDRPDGDDAQGL